jgi:hypothetical protein
MPWLRRNSATHPTNPLDWVTIANLYRKNSDGSWIKIRRAYRRNSATHPTNPLDWVIVHDSDSLKPYYTNPPTLESNGYLPSVFEDGNTLTLTRGTWANTGTSYAPVSYSLEIQSSPDGSAWSTVASGTGTTLTYTINLIDVRSPSYYFRGKVTSTNVNGSTFVFTGSTRSNMDFSVSSITAYTASNQIFVNWSFNKTNNSSNVSSQTVSIINNNAYTYNGQYFPAYTTVYSATVPVGTSLASILTGATNIKPSESIFAYISATANDSAGTVASDFSADFISPMAVGTVSISPSFSESGGYRRVESGSTVTAVTDGWPAGTTFTYAWYRSRSFSSQDDISLGTGSSITVPTSTSTTGERIWVDVYGTSSGQTSNAVFSGQHRIIPAPPSFTLGGGGSSITITSLTSTGGEYYFGTYSGPTSGTILETPIGTDYTIPDLVTGTYTVTLYSRAINGSMFSYVVTESNTATSQQKSIVALNPPTSVSATFSGGTFYISFSGGSGPYYQVWYNTSTTPGVNNPTSLGVTSYDFNGSSSPIAWTPPFVNYGTTYNFWVRSSNSLTAASVGDYSSWSNAYGQAAAPALTAPTITSVSSSVEGAPVTVYFTGGSGPYYQIYWVSVNPLPSQEYTPDAEGSSSPLTDNTGPGSASVQWYAYVRSVTSLGWTGVGPSSLASPWSSAYPFTVTSPNATAPTSVAAYANSATSVTVYWSGSSNATKYRVWWNTNLAGNGVNPTSSYDAETTNTFYTFNSMSGSTTYYFWVSAANANNIWTSYSLSPRGQATTPSAGTAPSTPTGLSNSYSSGPTWTGSWSASSGTAPITYYWTLYQSKSNGGSITATASGSTTGTSFARSMTSSNGLWAYYTVFASNSFGTSGTATSPWA